MTLKIGCIGVCLSDAGNPVTLWVVDTVWACGTVELFRLGGKHDRPRIVRAADFWPLLDTL